MTTSISIDAMGGDRAPKAVVRGAVRAAREMPAVHLHLVGIEDRVRAELDELEWTGDQISVVPASDVIEMGDSPAKAIRQKRDSSIHLGIGLVRAGAAQAFVSAGNTGACVAASQLMLKPLPGIRRSGIVVTMRVGDNPVSFVDVGANVSPKPEHLCQYGQMASIYSSSVLGIENPRVALLNIGEEDEKGTDLVRATRLLLQEAPVEYIGYIEGDDLYRDIADIVVCDGFSGNILLKASEGMAERLTHLMMSVLRSVAREAGVEFSIDQLIGSTISGLKERLDYSEYGGAPLLGVDGCVIVAHGRSDEKAIFNAIRAAERMVETEVNSQIAAQVAT